MLVLKLTKQVLHVFCIDFVLEFADGQFGDSTVLLRIVNGSFL